MYRLPAGQGEHEGEGDRRNFILGILGDLYILKMYRLPAGQRAAHTSVRPHTLVAEGRIHW